MRTTLMLLAFAATMITGCPAPSSAQDDGRVGDPVAASAAEPKAVLPWCGIQYKLRPGERAVEMCSLSRLHAQRGIVQIQTNNELLDASLVASSATACIDGPCTWDVIVAFTNRSSITTAGEITVRGW